MIIQADGVSEVRWRLSPTGERALIERFDDQIILFNPASWNTHYLNAAASIMFDELAGGARTVAELAAALGETFADPADSPELATHVEAALRDLVSIGLVTRTETGS